MKNPICRCSLFLILVLHLFVQPTHSYARSPGDARIISLVDGPRQAITSKTLTFTIASNELKREDILRPIYEGNHDLVPPGASDTVNYFFEFWGALQTKCTGVAYTTSDALPYLMATTIGVPQRVFSGKGTKDEKAVVVSSILASLNEHRSCHYDPGIESYSEAQARCSDATRASRAVVDGFLAHARADAIHDVDLLLEQYRCASPQIQNLTEQLYKFAKRAPFRSNFSSGIPLRRLGRYDALYETIFDNCARRSPGEHNAWCACYINALAHNEPSEEVLKNLASNPFVDGTYMALPFAGDLYDCTRHHGFSDGWRDSYAPRSTACLVESRKMPGRGTEECVYRAAWGTFILQQEKCDPEINSRRWGFQEVDCEKAGELIVSTDAPREWRSPGAAGLTHIDYEHEVSEGFSPRIPEGAYDKTPLIISLVTNDGKPGALRYVFLEGALSTYMGFHGHVMGPRIHQIWGNELNYPSEIRSAILREARTISEQGQFLLTCQYASRDPKALLSIPYVYWYKKAPDRVLKGMIDPQIAKYFELVNGVAENCPPQEPKG